MTDLRYPFDWEAHAAEQLARQEEEALANSARIHKEDNPRHPLDIRLVKVDYREPGYTPAQNLGLFYDPRISQAEMVLYLQQFWNINCIIYDGRLFVDLGIEHYPLDHGDWMVLRSSWHDRKDHGGYPLSNEEFLSRFVRTEG